MSGDGARSVRVQLWLALAGAALTGAVAVAMVLMVLDAVSPTTVTRAVVTDNERVTHHDRLGSSTSYRFEARAEDGRALALGRWGGQDLSYGDPVVLRLSRTTGHVVGVRGARLNHDRQLGAGRVFLLLLAGAVLVSVATWARGLWLVAPPGATVAAVAAGVLVAALVGLHGPQIDRTGPLPDEVGLQTYADLEPFPSRTAATGDPARVGNATLTVTGSMTQRPPAGAASWLSEFHVLVVPVRVTASGPDGPDFLSLELIGHGPGAARLVGAADCGAPGTAFDGESTAGAPVTIRSACFVVPAGFHAEHLIVSAAARDTTAIGVGLGADGP